MQYQGGKFQVRHQISSALESVRVDGQPYHEPFLGVGSVYNEMKPPKYGSDLNHDLISMFNGIMDGWTPPDFVSEEEYAMAKQAEISGHLRTWIGFMCSWGGEGFNGYARGHGGGSYSAVAKRSLARYHFESWDIRCLDYLSVVPEDSIVYVDPPYFSKKEMPGSVVQYDRFIDWCYRLRDRGNTVLVSGFSDAPYPFDVYKVLDRPRKTTNNVECLFVVD